MNDKLMPGADEPMKRLCQNLRDARLARGDTQSMLAERAGIGRATIERMERGEAGVSIGNLFAAAHALGLSGLIADSVASEKNVLVASHSKLQRARVSMKKRQRDWGADLF